jgi:RsiW-degrading membrane proteinase PrsW (M82 family)
MSLAVVYGRAGTWRVAHSVIRSGEVSSSFAIRAALSGNAVTVTDAAIAATTASSWAARRQLVWWIAAAATLLIFLWQWPFFIGTDLPRVATYALQHGYILAWMLLITSFTRTVSLRTLTAFWFVGVFPVMALVLAITRPIDELLDGGELAYAYAGPLVEELGKALPIVLLFGYRIWRGGWQLSATDGLLLGFMVGAGFAFHEDAGYDRVWGEGFGATPWSVAFPTLGYFRGAVLPYHDMLAALVGLSIGFGFLFRRYRLAWSVPVAVWSLVLAEHITGNLRDIAGRAAFPADLIRNLLLEGELLPAVLFIGLLAVVFIEWRMLRTAARRDLVFPGVPVSAVVSALRSLSRHGLSRLQAMRIYIRQRRSLHYAILSRAALSPGELDEMAQLLVRVGAEARVRVEDGSLVDGQAEHGSLATEASKPLPGARP